MALILAANARADGLLQAGEMAPDFSLADADGTPHQLTEWRGRWLVLYFYPKDNTPGCTIEAAAFRDRQADFNALKAQVVGVSVDSSASHRSFIDEQRLPFPLLSDPDGQVARRYGALTNFAIMKFAKRHTYLSDPDGRIAKVYRTVDPATHALEILADLKLLSS